MLLLKVLTNRVPNACALQMWTTTTVKSNTADRSNHLRR